MYEFSVPMIYDKAVIDDLCEFNNNLTESKIISFYDSLPQNSDFVTRLEQSRGINPKVNNLNDFLDFVKYVKSKGFEFVYLFNSASGINVNNPDKYKNVTESVDVLVKSLKNLGCNTFRVANTSTMQYLYENYPDVEIITSTVLCFTDILQYKNLLKIYPEIKEFCLHYENNHNFKLLKNLVNDLPNVKKEVLVNELCIKGCPLRNSHYNFINPKFSCEIRNLHNKYFKQNCLKIFYENLWESVCTSNIIYPWTVKKYSDIGINNFKIVGRSYYMESEKYYKDYLRAVEDKDFMMNMNFFSLFYNPTTVILESKNLPDIKVKDVLAYLPDIKYFDDNGHLCSSVCQSECNYCYDKAKALSDLYPVSVDFKNL